MEEKSIILPFDITILNDHINKYFGKNIILRTFVYTKKINGKYDRCLIKGGIEGDDLSKRMLTISADTPCFLYDKSGKNTKEYFQKGEIYDLLKKIVEYCREEVRKISN